MSIHAKSLNQLAYELEARAARARAESEHAVPIEHDEATLSKGFYMDTTLGTRTRPAQAAEVRKRESEIRLYSGFASRSDISGES